MREILRILGDAKSELSGTVNNLPHGELNMQTIFNSIYGFVGIVAVGFIVYGGISYINAHGDPGKVVKAKTSIVVAIAGLVIVALAGAITNFVFSTVGGAK